MDQNEYLNMEEAESRRVKDLLRARELGSAVWTLHSYGVFLEEHPEAFEYLEVTPTNRTFGPLNTSV